MNTPHLLSPVALALALGLSSLTLISACTTTPLTQQEADPDARAYMEQEVNNTLARLYQIVPGSREMVERAPGVLVFPAVMGGSFVVGAHHGKGALREHGHTSGYYSTTSGSIGLQAGGQSRSVIYVFNTQEALQRFKASSGWTAGADATVAMGRIGANGSVDTETMRQAVASFILTNVGLELGASVGAAKISPAAL